MLPNTDDLVLDFIEDEQEKTQTFFINVIELEDSDTTCLLGRAVLGQAILGNSVTNSTDKSEMLYYISGKCDGVAALQQEILLRLSIEADQYIIYPYTYGIKTLDLIGKPTHYVMAVIPERIKDALISDDRISDVSDFEFEVNGNKLTVKFIVKTIYGDIKEDTVVIY